MLPPHNHGPTLLDSGEIKAERFAHRGLPAAWEDDDGDDFDEKETQMIPLPSELPSSQRLLRVLPAVPSLWTPPPPAPRDPSAPLLPRIEALPEPHWVPEPPPPRVSLPSAESWTAVAPQPAARPFTPMKLASWDSFEEHGAGPHVAITIPTARTRAKHAKQRIMRRVILPWPAMVMIAAVAGGVVFEHVQKGDTWSTLSSLVRR